MVKKRKRKFGKYFLIMIGIFGICFFGYHQFTAWETRKLWILSFDQMVESSIENNSDALITVGFINGEESSWRVYGQNRAQTVYDYEVGSITKTMTAALVAKAIEDNAINLNDTIDVYLPLKSRQDSSYPNIEALLTHTSGYKAYYFEWDTMIPRYLQGQNMLGGVSKDQLIKRIEEVNLNNEDIGQFNYSNFGISVLGLVLEEIYQEDYTSLIQTYIAQESGMKNTWISGNNQGDLTNYWEWEDNAAYLPAGAIVSNIEDMLIYLSINMSDKESELAFTHQQLADVAGSQQEEFNLYIDGIGMTWMLDTHNNIIWHNGATDNYNSYIGFDKEAQIGVVILSNLPIGQNRQVPATVMGPQLLMELKQLE